MTNTRDIVPGYIALDETDKSATEVLTYAHQLHPDVRYRIVADEFGYWVLRRV